MKLNGRCVVACNQYGAADPKKIYLMVNATFQSDNESIIIICWFIVLDYFSIFYDAQLAPHHSQSIVNDDKGPSIT